MGPGGNILKDVLLRQEAFGFRLSFPLLLLAWGSVVMAGASAVILDHHGSFRKKASIEKNKTERLEIPDTVKPLYQLWHPASGTFYLMENRNLMCLNCSKFSAVLLPVKPNSNSWDLPY